jgi:hypothetical protein
MAVKLDVAGPSPSALFVIDGAAAGAAAPPTELVSGPGYRGVLLTRGVLKTAIICSDAPDAVAPGAAFVYRVPAGTAVRHIVLDAPRGNQGRSEIVAKAVGPDCEVTVVAANGAGGVDGAPLVIDVAPSCIASDPGPGQVDGEGSSATPASGTVNVDPAAQEAGASGSSAEHEAGAGCTVVATGTSSRSFATLALVASLALAARRRRRRAVH